jgi:hypothetical protein
MCCGGLSVVVEEDSGSLMLIKVLTIHNLLLHR